MIKTAVALSLAVAVLALFSPAAGAESPACRWEGSFRVCGGKPKPLLGPVKEITIRNPFYRNRDTAAESKVTSAPAAQSATPTNSKTRPPSASAPVLAPSTSLPTTLSRQAGSMIASGDCAGARAAVLSAGDLALAVQVDQLCTR